eukprot:543567_1
MFQCIISTFHLNALCVMSHSSYTKVQRFSAHDPEQTNYSNTVHSQSPRSVPMILNPHQLQSIQAIPIKSKPKCSFVPCHRTYNPTAQSTHTHKTNRRSDTCVLS